MRKIGAVVLTGAFALSLIQGGTPPAHAAIPASPDSANYPYYNNYYNQWLTYSSLYSSTGYTPYYYYANAYLEYYYAGFYGDYAGYNLDSLGQKSVYFKGRSTSPNPSYLTSTYEASYYNYYGWFGDYYISLL